MSWADDEDDVPCAAVAPFHPPAPAAAAQPRPSLLAPSLPDRDSRAPRSAPASSMQHARAADAPSSKGKGHQGQRDDIARIQKSLSNASGPVSTLADRMGANPWSKPAAQAGPQAAAVVTPRQSQAALEPQRKPLVLAPRTQPLPVFPDPTQAPSRPSVAPAAAVSHASTADSDAPVTPKPSTPKSDPFGGARPVDESKAAEIRKKLLEEKAQLEASRLQEAKLASEKSDSARHQDERPSSARGGGWGSRGRSGERTSSDPAEVKILQRSMEKAAISHPPAPAAIQSADSQALAGTARQGLSSHVPGGAGKASKPTALKQDETTSTATSVAPARGPPQSPKLDSAAVSDGSGRTKGAPKSPILGPTGATVADSTPSSRGKGKRKESGGKGKAPQASEDLPLPFDS